MKQKTLTVPKGKNFFGGKIWPFYPFFREELNYQFCLGPEWWDGQWTEPLIWGCKQMTVGRAPSYHRGGMNMGMTWRGEDIVIYPRYYGRRKMYTTNDLHELSQYGRVINPGEWVTIKMVMKPRMEWWINGELVHSIEQTSPVSWFHYCYLGRAGWDLNYPGYDLTHNKFAKAARDLSIDFRFERKGLFP